MVKMIPNRTKVFHLFEVIDKKSRVGGNESGFRKKNCRKLRNQGGREEGSEEPRFSKDNRKKYILNKT